MNKFLFFRITGCILLLTFCPEAFAQLTIKSGRQKVRQVIQQIEKGSDYNFFYSDDFLDLDKEVNIRANNEKIEGVLDKLFKNTNIEYKIDNKQIVLTTRTIRANSVNAANHNTKKISGIIIDPLRNPLVGVSVVVKGTNRGTTTDLDGRFTLNEVRDQDVLMISYIGFTSQEITVRNQSSFTIRLEEARELLEEVVVIGYGTTSRKIISTSVGQMKLEDIEQGADYNPLKMLQGRVAGVNVSSSSGKPGAMPNILVRGSSSISGNSRPLYVVDGIPTESFPIVNANDIESIDILKDASSAAIYGSRGNNGVVIVTTKNGSKGKTQVDYSGRFGIGTIANNIKMANATQYQEVMQVATDNYNAQMGTVGSLFVPDEIQETNWLSLIERNQAYQTSHAISMTGGNENTLFYTSFGYNKQEGALRKSDYNQFNVRAKFEHKVNNYVKVFLNLSGSHTRYDQVEDSDGSLKVIRTAREEQPWYNPYKEDGGYKENGVEILRHNPVMLINEEDWVIGKKQGAITFKLEITPFKGFKYTPSGSLFGILDEERKKISEKHDARKYNADWAALTEAKNVSSRYVIDNIFTYENSFQKLRYTLTAGHAFERYQYETFGAKSDNYADGAFPSSSFDVINASANIYPGSIGFTGFALESYLARAVLNYDNKYILTAAVRRDGSSKFSQDSRYGTFPSVSVAWRAIEEDFIPKVAGMSDLKLRLSWGSTGNHSGIGNWSALSLVAAGGSSYNGAAGFRISQDAQNLKWEKSNQVNIGLDAEFLKGRLGFSIDAFYTRTTDLLYNKPVVATTGYTSIASNIGSLENKGLELAVNGQILKGEFNWFMDGNISFVRNKLLKLLDGQDTIVLASGGANAGRQKHALIIGKPISAYYMLEADGLYQRDEDVPEKLYAKGVRAGDVKYVDVNEDGDINEDDRKYVGKTTPDFFGGLTSTMTWRNFELSIFAQFSVGGKIFSAWRGGGGMEGTDHLGVAMSTIKAYRNGSLIDVNQFYNISEHVATNYWRGEGTTNSVPRPVMKGVHTGYEVDYNTQTSTRYLENASYFKIKSITLAYNLPPNITNKLKIRGARIYTSLDNFFTFTKYTGYDPEFSYNESPGNTNYGVDWGELPTLKNWVIGVNINF